MGCRKTSNMELDSIKFDFLPFEHCGLIKSKIPKSLLSDILKSSLLIFNKKNLQKPLNKGLAGNLEKEYIAFFNQEFNKFLLKMALFYNNAFNLNEKYFVKDVWLNFQKKYEFNPLHTHDGLLSFVCWLQIPYDLTKEKENPSSVNSNSNYVADFYYVEFGTNNAKTISLSKENEGEIIMFDSTMLHGVYPFYTSDDYRISIAGNLSMKKENQSTIKYG